MLIFLSFSRKLKISANQLYWSNQWPVVSYIMSKKIRRSIFSDVAALLLSELIKRFDSQFFTVKIVSVLAQIEGLVERVLVAFHEIIIV